MYLISTIQYHEYEFQFSVIYFDLIVLNGFAFINFYAPTLSGHRFALKCLSKRQGLCALWTNF